MMTSVDSLRRYAITQSLFAPTTLAGAIHEMGFVQADPIRSPARAQDLILRHRVTGYQVGDLEREYEMLGLDEDELYAYGFMSQSVAALLHPRQDTTLSPFETEVLAVVRAIGATHPRALVDHFEQGRVINAWGGYSSATKQALESLHHKGYLRVLRRRNGVRVYDLGLAIPNTTSTAERLEQITMVMVRSHAPVREKTLRAMLSRASSEFAPKEAALATIERLIADGRLQKSSIDGATYVYRSGLDEEGCELASSKLVRFIAPFDPLVWDRQRFEQLWGWQYRFEAYTPKAKRVMGYYALPMLWGEQMVGWVNARVMNKVVTIEPEYVGSAPVGAGFKEALEAEIGRFTIFLKGRD